MNIRTVILLICLQCLTSCAVNSGLWAPRAGGDKISSFFIDHDKQRVVLIGDQHPVTKAGDHYSISDPDGKLVRVFELGQKSGSVAINLGNKNIETKGSSLFANGISVSINKKNFSKEELKELYEIGFKDSKYLYPESVLNSRTLEQSQKDYFRYMNENNGFMISKLFSAKPLATRYPSSQETLTNLCSETNNSPTCSKVTKFETPWQGVIWDRFTAKDKAIRVALTPFALVADILLTPLYIIGVIGMGVGGR